uniref:Uncharacterized protein n=1 Tax=Avena sativa TaxID=4498 RepID=A0ACD5ZFV3_AVESA
MYGAGGDRCHRRVDNGGASPSTSLERRSSDLPTVSTMYGPQGWADLPDALLHSIASLLVSFPDLLAFTATCPSWRAAFSSYPSESGLSSLLPPLLIQPDVPLCSPQPRPYSSSLVPRRPCHATNLASQSMYMCCQIPLFCHFGNRNGLPCPLDKFIFIGASYGHLILSNKQSGLVVAVAVVDVFTGLSVSPPQLPVPVDEDNQFYHATLTAPLVSPNSHLMVTTRSYNFFWRVGSDSWVRGSKRYKPIRRVVVFKGQVFGTHNNCELFTVHLVPRIRIQKIAVDLGESEMFNRPHFFHTWLVACGDMLLMVGCPRSSPSTEGTFEAFRLDLSPEPAKWVKVKKLGNWAIFISVDERSQALCCMDPERWGGRRNCIYCYDSNKWIACKLGKPLQRGASSRRFNYGSIMQPMWVVPSMLYPCP